MTLAGLKTLLETTKYSVAYQSFPESDVPDMPFICFAEVGSDNFAADGKVYLPVKVVEVQLFTKKKDTTAEAAVESALQDLYWTKECEYIEDELCHRIVYSIEF